MSGKRHFFIILSGLIFILGFQLHAQPSDLADKLTDTGRYFDSAVVERIKLIPRRLFISASYAEIADENIAAPGPDGGIIPSPEDTANAVSLLSPAIGDRVLIAGSNAGYAAALLAGLCDEVFLIEETADINRYRRIFEGLGIGNIVISGDGSLDSFGELVVFDRILVHAAVSELPENITEKLAITGNITFALGLSRGFQQLVSLRRSLLGDSIITAGSCYFPDTKKLSIGN